MRVEEACYSSDISNNQFSSLILSPVLNVKIHIPLTKINFNDLSPANFILVLQFC